ncbi:hypothetical protein VIGAN_06042900 [Vigna angularis var. angularis]|uniref:Beta-glucosidase n=1 Tax=Vigna angularis var. angularis TaxID=157739 RepID=A0A0S3S9J8_PHAAN|nr:hypothetical protein VIGAN_06042900 [Vigna angularis var. angularis]
MFGWYMEPLTSRKYPVSMCDLVGNQLPEFSEKESELLADSIYFLGLNYYTTYYATDAPKASQPSYTTDSDGQLLSKEIFIYQLFRLCVDQYLEITLIFVFS